MSSTLSEGMEPCRAERYADARPSDTEPAGTLTSDETNADRAFRPTSQDLRILHVIPSISTAHGGPTAAIRLMATGLAQRGIEVHLATTNDDGPGRVTDWPIGGPQTLHGLTTFVFPKQSDFYKVSWPMLQWLRLSVAGYDVVHVHALFSFTSVAAAWAARRVGVPYVIRPLGVLARYGMTQRRRLAKQASFALFERRLLRDAAVVHFTSESERVEAEMLGVPMRSTVLQLGVASPGTGDANRFVKRYPQTAGAIRLLFLSRIDPKKNLEGLLRALALRQPGRKPDLLLVAGRGEPAYESHIRQLAGVLGIANRVVWLGHVEGEDKADLLAAAHLFVLPSHSENFGIAAAEALAASLPCVLGRGVALAAEVEAAGAGIAVDPTPESVASAISAYLDDPARIDVAKAAAARLATERYSVQRMAKDLEALYVRIVANDQVNRHA